MEVSLTSIEEFLKSQSFNVTLQRASQEIPLDHLVLNFGVDERNRPQSMNLYVIEKELGSLSPQKKKGIKGHLYPSVYGTSYSY